MHCQHCGALIQEGAKFCGVCGAPMAETPAPVTPPVEPSPAEPPVALSPECEPTAPAKKKVIWWIPLVAAIVAAAVAFGACYFIFGSSEEAKEEQPQNGPVLQTMLNNYVALTMGDASALERTFPSAALSRMSIDVNAIKADPRYAAAMQAEFSKGMAAYGANGTFAMTYISDAEVDANLKEEVIARIAQGYGLTVEDARMITFTMTAKGELGSDSSEQTQCAVKIGGAWYLFRSGEFYLEDSVQWLVDRVQNADTSVNEGTLAWDDEEVEEDNPTVNDAELVW